MGMKKSFEGYWENIKDTRLCCSQLEDLIVHKRRRSIGIGHLKYKVENGVLAPRFYNRSVSGKK